MMAPGSAVQAVTWMEEPRTWPPVGPAGPLLFRLSSPSSGFGDVTENIDLILSPFEAKRRGLHQDNSLQSLPEAPASTGRGVDPAPHVPSAPGT